MLLEELKNIDSSKKVIRKFSYQVGIILGLLGLLLSLISKSIHFGVIIAGLLLIITGLLRPILLYPLHKLWMGLSIILGFISTRVILFLIYYFVLTPIAVIGRIAGKDFLDEKIDKKKDSYWYIRDASTVSDNLNNDKSADDNLKRQF